MKTCKDCKHYKELSVKSYNCAYLGLNYTIPDLCPDAEDNPNNFKKTNKMELTKEQKYIKEKYEKLMNSDCNDQKRHAKELRETFPELFKRELPKSWEEFCEIKNIDSSTAFNYSLQTRFADHSLKKDYKLFWGSHDLLPEKYIALRKLELLRDYYNDGDKIKGPYYAYDELFINIKYYEITFKFLRFKNKDLAKEFFNNFKDLIKQAEDLV